MDATTYHTLTSYSRDRMTPFHLDWGHVPLLQKAYPALPSVPLNPPDTLPDKPLTAVLGSQATGDSLRPALGFQDLSAILMLANGITAQRRYPSHTHFFRSAPSAGALYPNEIYVAAENVEELPAGLYNYLVKDASLAILGKGRFGQGVVNALTIKGTGLPAASLLITGIFFRSAWKYRDRAFRYVLLDAGHLIENVVLAARANRYAVSIHYDFDDAALGHLLGIDSEREACLAVVNLFAQEGVNGGVAAKQPGPSPPPRELRKASRTSTAEIQYEAILEMCAAGEKVRPVKAREERAFPVVDSLPRAWFPIGAEATVTGEQPFADIVLKRRSRRNFVPVPMSPSQAVYLMKSLCLYPENKGDDGLAYRGCMTTGFAATSIQAFDPGIYLLDTDQGLYGLASGNASGEQVARVCLDQAWLKNGSLHVLFLANLPLIDRQLGARGYRYAMLNAGRAGQRIYLAATDLGLGACGIGAIYDDEARQMLSLSDESALLYLVAVGATK